MTKAQYSQVVTVLSEHPIYNTSEDFSLSITHYKGIVIEDYTIKVFSSSNSRCFVSCVLNHLLQVAEVFRLNLSVDSRNGVPVVRLT